MPALAAKILPVYMSMVPKVKSLHCRECTVVMQTGAVHQAVNSFYYVVALGDEVGNAELVSDSLVEKIFWFAISWSSEVCLRPRTTRSSISPCVRT